MAKRIFLNYFIFMCITVQIISGQELKRSLIIVFDVTVSMTDELNSMRDGVKLLIESFTSRKDNPISEYVLVQFRDEDYEPVLIPIILESSAKEMNKHLDALAITNVSKNYDCLESCFRGIKYGLEKANENSIMFVFTDAGTKHKEMKPELEKLIQQKKVTVYFFLTEGCARDPAEMEYYRDLAIGSNGLVFDVDYRQIREHFPKYGEVIYFKLGLYSQLQGGPWNSKVEVNVDSSMKEFTLPIVTPKPLITICDPNNIPINDYEMFTDLPTIKMLKVREPIPGKWIVQVKETTPYTGQVSVISDLSFKYGFAKHEPNDITQTSFSPLIGQNNYLAIAPSNSSLIGNLDYVILDTKSGPHKFPLHKKTVAGSDLYITGSIELPKVPFKVILHGIDPVNNEIKRLLSPDIAPRPPNKPETINVQEGEPIYLICCVDSMVDITVSWYKVGQAAALNSLSFQQSNILNHTITESQISDAGEYICVAKNRAGEDEMKTIVDVRRTILKVNTPIKQHLAKVGTKSIVLKCVVIPKMAGVDIHWLFNGKPDLPPGTALNLPNLILNNINRNFNGTYTCVAQRKSEIQQDNIEVNVLYPAKILNMFNLSSYSLIDVSKPVEIIGPSELKVLCDHEGNPTAQVKWINQDGVVFSSTPTLVVTGTDIKQAGDYICQVENTVGQDEKRIKVNIITKPKLQQSFDRVYRKNLGDRFSLDCPLEVVPNQKMEIVWYQNATRIQQSLIFDDRIIIEKLDHVHNGKYKCQASNKAGTAEAEFDVNVLYRAKILKIVKLDDTGSNILDPSIKRLDIFNTTKFSLTCVTNGNPPPTITWKKNGVILSHTIQESQSSIEIDPEKSGFSALYTCTVHNELNFDERSIELFEINMDITGNPTSDFYWLKNDQMYRSGNTIVIHSVGPNDGATYTCVAENTFGNQTEKITVIVYVPPYLLRTAGLLNSTNTNNINKVGMTVLNRVQMPDTYFKADYEQIIKVNEGEKVLLDCSMGGYPIPKLDWFKNNVNLNKQTAVLEFKSASIKDSGIYKCVGGNTSRNKMVVIFYLNVQKPISVVSATSTKPVYEKGDEIRFTCKTKGNQLPVIVWKGMGSATDNENIFKSSDDDLRKQALQRDEPLYLNGGKIVELNEIDALERYGKISYDFVDGEYIGTLEYVIKSAKFSDSGSYSCITQIYQAKNSQEHYPVKIDIGEERYIESAETEYSILEDIASHKIICPIKGIPNSIIEWYRETSVITSDQHFDVQNNFLEFKNPTLHHAGEYSCRGTNIGGSVEFKFKVIIFKHIADISNLVLNRSINRKLEIKKGETKELQCSFKVMPIYWSKIIDAYPNKQRELLMANSTYNFYAGISSDIMCSKEADPKYGEIFQITVLEKPKIQQAETNVEVKLDDILLLKCDAQGEPKPTIKWYKYDRGQQYDIKNYPELEAYGEILVKRRVENSDTTKYVCTAQNKLGTDSHVFDVIVLNDSHYFSAWSHWSACTKTCGQGTQFRTRNCIHASCNRQREREERECRIIECAIDGGWSGFTRFGQCSKTCVLNVIDIPSKQSKRECNNPVPAFGGKDCKGESVRILNCTVPLCASVSGHPGLIYPPCLDEPICCPFGFEHDDHTRGCKEIDKCKRKGTYAVCKTNTKCRNVGADDYECVCLPGYKLKPGLLKKESKNPRCIDIDECREHPYPCGEWKCSNSRGSFKCLIGDKWRI